jgi:LemA protein
MATVVIIVVLVAIVGLVAWGIAIWNSIVRLENRIDNAWSQIDVQIKRRLDLIPNLVETVKGYAAHERETLERVVQARNQAMAAQGPREQGQAQNVISDALRQLFALSESYPDLKANQNFMQLQEELTATEDRIAYARQFYNDTVLLFNNKIETFPGLLFKGSRTPREMFEEPGLDRSTPPQVSFT